MVAYHSGNAANVAPPATSSQTSLPSQTGPIVLEHRALLLGVAAEERQQHADAEVEPLEHEVARPENGEQTEPELLETHQ